MKNRLRDLALTVNEEAIGEFYWKLLESLDGSAVYQEIARSPVTFNAYDVALAAGYGALQRVVGAELEHGPRIHPDLDAPPAASHADAIELRGRGPAIAQQSAASGATQLTMGL
jgi:hypothetical protein